MSAVATASVAGAVLTAAAPTLTRVRMVMLADEELNANPPSWLKTRANARRLASLGRTWVYVGVMAKAEILAGNCVQRISSGGVWGVESDAHNVLKDVGAEQFDELREILAAIGIAVEAPFTSLTWGER